MKIRNFFSKINVRIATSFFLISLIFVVFISAIAYYSASNIILESNKKQTSDSILQASNYISAYLDKIKSLSDLIAMYPKTAAALNHSDKDAIESLAGMVNISANSDPRIQTIALISKNGFAITSNSNMAIPLSENMMDESWYEAALKSKQMPVITSIRHGEFDMDKSSWVISISHEIRDDAGEHLGVVLIDVSYKFIEDYISALELGQSGYAFILDSNNQVLYHRDESILMDKMKANELLALSDKSNLMGVDDKIITKQEIPHSNWRLVGISSMESVDMLRSRFINTIVIVNLILLLASIVISFLISRRLTKPIVELQNAMMNLDENWGHITLDKRSSSEIKALGAEYNALLDRIKLLTEDIAQKENAKRVFELKALQSQINPHFLYNTLDTILWLAEFGENQKVVEVSKALGEMLRLSLSINHDLVPLEQELAHVKNYLRIQQERYVDKLSYIIKGDESLLNVNIPKLIIQPIVENAIYHGIRPKNGKGMIEIEYKKQGEYLIIRVEDNGVGYHPEQKSSNNLIKAKLGGIGMKNVDQRIKILCGEDCGIHIKRAEFEGSIVIYKLKI